MTPLLSRWRAFVIHLWSWVSDHGSLITAHVALALIGLILVAPLLQGAPLCTDDGALHLYRTVALDHALGDGLLYPRWFPDLAFGYGFPFFNYREPLGYYAVEAIHQLGADFPLALNLVLALGVIAAGQTMLLWVRSLFDTRAGFISGLVYLAAPYTLIGALTRGNLPEVLACALLPLILWAFRRLLLRGGRLNLALAVLSYAALLLTHNISSLIFTPILLAYVVLLTAYTSRPARHAWRWPVFAIVLGLTLTAFFWLPALTEGQFAQLYLTHSTRGNDYHFNFVTLSELLAGPGTSDPLLINPPLRLFVGWPQLALALMGSVAVFKLTTREQRAHSVAAAALTLVCLFMALAVSLPLWENLPLIRFVQFPWRFVGRALLPAALLAGAATYALARSPRITRQAFRSAVLLIGLALGVLIFAAPQLYPRTCPAQPNLSITSVFAYERASGHIGVDPLGAYLPSAVQVRPTGSPLEADYANGDPIARFDRSSLPAEARIERETYGPNTATIDLSSPNGFRATYLTFYFPGWQVHIDGAPVPPAPTEPTGLITFDVPAGPHRVEVFFASTPLRTAAEALSLISAIVLGVIIFRPRQTAPSPATTDRDRVQPLALIVVPLLFLIIKLAVIDPQLTPLRQTRLHADQILGGPHALSIDFGDQLRLLGYEVSPGASPSGETVRVDLYWRALRPLDAAYQTTVGLADAAGEVWSPKTLYRPRDYQDFPDTNQWPVEQYAVDSFELPVNPGTPPGTYTLFVEVFQRRTLQPLAASAPHPAARPFAAVIAAFEVTPATRTFNADELGIYNFRLDQAVTADLILRGVNIDRVEVLPGDGVLLTFFWQATRSPAFELTVQLIDDRGLIITEDRSTFSPQGQAIQLRRVRVPLDLQTGRYRWRGLIGGQVIFEGGELRVTAPDRTFAAPPIAQRVDQTFAEQITLLGYNGAPCARGTACALTLIWRAEQALSESYTVFVQLLDANGVPRAQSDAVPASGTRPTTSWLPPEVVLDAHTLNVPHDLPAGNYRLVAGLYSTADLSRLPLQNGADAVELGVLLIP